MPLSHKDETLLGYRNCYNFMQINYGDPTYGQDFYEYIFPDNEVSGENNKNFSKPNAHACLKINGKMTLLSMFAIIP